MTAPAVRVLPPTVTWGFADNCDNPDPDEWHGQSINVRVYAHVIVGRRRFRSYTRRGVQFGAWSEDLAPTPEIVSGHLSRLVAEGVAFLAEQLDVPLVTPHPATWRDAYAVGPWAEKVVPLVRAILDAIPEDP